MGTTTTTTIFCDGCNCQGATKELESGDVITLTSPDYPDKYPNKAECTWKYTNIDGGKLKTEITYMDIQSSNGCTSKDYLYIATMKSYGKVYLCGTKPGKKKNMTSKNSNLTVKFKSNGSTRKGGFVVTITAA